VPIEFDIWRITGGHVVRVTPTKLEVETKLDTVLAEDIGVLGLDVLIIGRQVLTAFGKKIDFLAMNAQGHLCVIENKRDRTPREVVAQILDYASWVATLTYDDIARIYAEHVLNQPLEQAFTDRFGDTLPEPLNEQHHLYIVASELDPSTERIVRYLSTQYQVPINAIFFRYYKDPPHEYLARTWLIERKETDPHPPRKKGEWNGQDFYVSLGEGIHRSWQDCRRYEFVSGGQGQWYSRTLNMLFVGARLFVCIPNKGYVGVGCVREKAQPVKDFMVDLNGTSVPILQAPLEAPNMGENAENLDLCEYLVRVEWLTTLPVEQAIWEKGMFANQNTVCRLSNKFTLDRLIDRFGLAA
jgi:hypothetical protein